MAKNVMIIPEAPTWVKLPQAQANATGEIVTKDVLKVNWLWAKQWKGALPSDRETVTVRIDGDIEGDFIPAIRRAASLARGKYVILFTGHGSRAPDANVKYIKQFQFDTVPEPGYVRLDNRTRAITARVLDLSDLADKQNGRWVVKPEAQQKKVDNVVHFGTLTQGYVDGLAARWRIIEAMRDEFKKNGVRKLIVLTCNVGNYPFDCARLATLINLPTVFYKDYIGGQVVDLTMPPDPLVTRTAMLWATPTREGPPPMDPFKQQGWKTARWSRHPFWTQLPNGRVAEFAPGSLGTSTMAAAWQLALPPALSQVEALGTNIVDAALRQAGAAPRTMPPR
jgi:hypothetical protein